MSGSSGTINCPSDDECLIDCSGGYERCSGATLNCPATFPCTVQCTGEASCSGSATKINCPGSAACNIVCGGSSSPEVQTCQGGAEFECPTSADCFLECKGEGACSGGTQLTCPSSATAICQVEADDGREALHEFNIVDNGAAIHPQCCGHEGGSDSGCKASGAPSQLKN
eukprot:gene15452-biopygen3686